VGGGANTEPNLTSSTKKKEKELRLAEISGFFFAWNL
jgi:hypothetical protein